MLQEELEYERIPKRICTGNGANFYIQKFKKCSRTLEIQHTTSFPHHPKRNGGIESAVKIAKQLLKKSNKSKEDNITVGLCLNK